MKSKFLRPLLWLASAAAFGIGFAYVLGPGRAPAASSEHSTDTYESLKPFSEAYAYIQNMYVDKAKTDPTELLHGAIRGMISTLDPFSQYMTPDEAKDFSGETHGTFEGIGIEIGVRDRRIVVISPIDDTPAYKAGLKAGDWIMKVGDESTEKLTLPQIVRKIRGERGTKVTLTIWRDGFKEPQEFPITRGTIKLITVRSALLDEGVGYVRLSEFLEKTPDDLSQALSDLSSQGMKSLVLDVRNNPGGLLNVSAAVVRNFIGDEKLIVYTAGRNKAEERRFTADKKAPYGDVPMVVLINVGSASASEIVAGAIQDWGRGVLMGTRSFGKGSVQQLLGLSDKSSLRLTTAKYYTPKGRSIHGTGIEPDITLENPPNLSQASVKLLDGDWFAKFAKDYLVQHPAGIPEPKVETEPGAEPPTRDEIEAERRRIEDDMIREVVRMAHQGGVDVTEDALGPERNFVLDQIRIEITRKLKGDKEAYRAAVMSDPQVQRARDLLRAAPIFKKLG